MGFTEEFVNKYQDVNVRTFEVVFPKNGEKAYTINITGGYFQVSALLDAMFQTPICIPLSFNSAKKVRFEPVNTVDSFVVMGYAPGGLYSGTVWADVIPCA